MYMLRKGRLLTASTKLSSITWLGRIVGGICMLSDTVLELVRIIHTKGKIITTAPRIRKKYVRKVDVRLDCPMELALITGPP